MAACSWRSGNRICSKRGWIGTIQTLAHAQDQRAVVSTQAFPGRTFKGRLTWVSDTIDERTRTRKARLELPNPSAALMPGAFVTVELSLTLDRGLGVPESAVIRTGERAIVFVMHGMHAQPREIKLGARVGNYYRVAAGLTAGEHVATGAQFLLDSESRLQATGGGGGHVH